MLDRQVDALQTESMWKIGRWLLRRFQDASSRYDNVKIVLDLGSVSRTTLQQQWVAQVAAQLVKPPRMYAAQHQLGV